MITLPMYGWKVYVKWLGVIFIFMWSVELPEQQAADTMVCGEGTLHKGGNMKVQAVFA
jgi:hypothetical protein